MFNEETKSAETKARILDAAETIFAEKGIDGARVDEIAAAARINKRMLYHYFGSKENLYLEVLKKNYTKILKLGQVVLARDEDPCRKAAAAIKQYFYFLAENKKFVRLVSWEALYGSKYSGQVIPEFLNQFQFNLADLFKSGIEQGLFRSDLDIGQLLISVHGLCLMYFSRKDIMQTFWEEDLLEPRMLEKRVQHILDLVFQGILTQPDRKPE